MRLEPQEAGGVPWQWAFSSCHTRTLIHNLNSGQCRLLQWETAQVLAWYFLWRSGRCKTRVFSAQTPEDTQELGTRKTDFPFYPAKEPTDIWAKFLYLHRENIIRTFQHWRTESIASFFPSSHLAPAGTQKPSLLWKEKLSGMMLTDPRLCFCCERSLSTKTPPTQNSSFFPSWSPLSPLPHPWQSSRLTFFTAKINTIEKKKNQKKATSICNYDPGLCSSRVFCESIPVHGTKPLQNHSSPAGQLTFKGLLGYKILIFDDWLIFYMQPLTPSTLLAEVLYQRINETIKGSFIGSSWAPKDMSPLLWSLADCSCISAF